MKDIVVSGACDKKLLVCKTSTSTAYNDLGLYV